MPQPPDDPVLSVFVYGTMLLSVVVGIYLIAKSRRGPLLAYQPRTPVPWGEIALLLPALFVVFALLSPFQGREETEPHKKAASNQAAPQVDMPSSHAATQMVASIVPELLLVGGVLFLVAVYYEASRRDLGLPASGSEFTRDVFIGIVAGIAALRQFTSCKGCWRL